jgi:steroid delta-isomerase-like uncharacterized protein
MVEEEGGNVNRYPLAVSLAFMLCFASACQDEASKADLGRFRAEAESVVQNKELVRRFIAAVDTNDFPKLQELASPDYVLKAPGLSTPMGLQASFEVVKQHYTSFPDWRHTIEDLVAEGDTVAVKVMQKGTQQAEYDGVAATGKEVTMPGVYVFRIANGKIQELWAIEDNLGLYRQLGLELKAKGQK